MRGQKHWCQIDGLQSCGYKHENPLTHGRRDRSDGEPGDRGRHQPCRAIGAQLDNNRQGASVRAISMTGAELCLQAMMDIAVCHSAPQAQDDRGPT